MDIFPFDLGMELFEWLLHSWRVDLAYLQGVEVPWCMQATILGMKFIMEFNFLIMDMDQSQQVVFSQMSLVTINAGPLFCISLDMENSCKYTRSFNFLFSKEELFSME